jgi:hypothetical protein
MACCYRATRYGAMPVAVKQGRRRPHADEVTTHDDGSGRSEMLLISQAIDQAVSQIDFSPMKGKTVYLEDKYFADDLTDRGYLLSTLRQQLLAHGALVMEDRKSAIYIVEPRSGGVGTDRHTLLVGTPSITIPAGFTPITNIPEIALAKKTDQKGIAKIAVFAYNRVNGRAVWQSGIVEDVATLKDTWVFGAGPFSRGSIRRRTELAGEPLPKLQIPFVTEGNIEEPAHLPIHSPAEAAEFTTNAAQPLPAQPVPFGIMALVGPAIIVDRPLIR